MSYTKKIHNFLLEAKKSAIIDDDSYHKLTRFANEQGSKAAANKIIGIISFLGGLAILLGMILVISHNWKNIPDLVKISAYLVSLPLVHLIGYLLRETYPRISSALHFLGAGYVLAGIGLVAQIFHLSSNDGQAFLIWFVMIIPLAVILKNKMIGVLAVVAFYVWLTINVSYHSHLDSFKGAMIYFMAMSINLMLLPRMLNSFEDSFDHLNIIGVAIFVLLLMLLGFSHDIGPHSKFDEFSVHIVVKFIIIANIIFLGWLFFKGKSKNFITDKAELLLLAISLVLVFFMTGNLLMLTSVIYWMIWFIFAAIKTREGVVQENRSLINQGTWLMVIGIIARFIDVVGTMLFTGSMFIIFGVVLIVLAVLGEKYRKYLIRGINK
jgi:uncharacterized membrane protein